MAENKKNGKPMKKIDVSEKRRSLYRKYNNQFYNLWQSSRKWSGDGITPERANYLMKQLWGGYTYDITGQGGGINGTIAALEAKVKGPKQTVPLGEIVFAPYSPNGWNIDDGVETATLINKRNSPLIPQGTQQVGKDIVIGYATKGHNSIYELLRPYIDELVEIDMVANVQLKTLNMPFLLQADSDDLSKVQDLLLRILNNEPAIACEFSAKDLVQVLNIHGEYIIDKLRDHRVAVYNEALTVIGIDNMGSIEKKAQISKDETNSNNMLIASFQTNIDLSLQEFCDTIKEVLNLNLSFENSISERIYDKDEVPDIAEEGAIDTNEGKPASEE